MHGQIFIGRVNEPRPDCVNIRADRKTPLGNPFPMRNEFERDCVCDDYRKYLQDSIRQNHTATINGLKAIYNHVINGQNVNLQCWCAPKRCHTETIRAVVLNAINKSLPY